MTSSKDSENPRTVIPRKPGAFVSMRIVAADPSIGMTLDEEGEVRPFSDFVEGFQQEVYLSGPMLIATAESGMVLSKLQERWEGTPLWYSKTSRRERMAWSPALEGAKRKTRITVGFDVTVPHYCGWRYDSRFRTPPRNCPFLDPVVFYLTSEKILRDIFGIPPDLSLGRLLDWARAVRQFCKENDLRYRQTQGALGAQFLTDPRFYPEPRRKVPKATNDRLRKCLPGNYNRVLVRTGRGDRFNAYYLDQRRAHHHHARTVRLPDANSMFAYGDFARLKELCLDPMAFLGGEVEHGFHGVVAGEFAYPERWVAFMPPRWRGRAVSRRMVSTAEWPWLANIGVSCVGLYAAWGSAEVDAGIPLYAAYAGSQLDLWESRPLGSAWVKPVLLSTYGALAVSVDSTFEVLMGGECPPGKERAEWTVGAATLHGFLTGNTRGRKVEPGIVNTLHRLMLESATRTESLSYANFLHASGFRVLMVHTDGLIVEDCDREVPGLFDPWRVKSYLTGLTFHDEQSFESLEMTRMPGRSIASRQMVAVRPPRPFRYEKGLLTAIAEP